MARSQRIEANPFVFDRPLDPADLIDREEELALLAERRQSGVNSRLASPRDYGKTSLLHRVVEEARGEGQEAVLVDLYGSRTAGQMAAQIERAYERLPGGPFRKAFAALRKRGGRVGISSPVGGGSLAMGGGEAGERALLDMLELPSLLHQRTGQRMMVAFDEFQVVLETGLDALIRSVIQHHGTGITYIFSGSHPGMMVSLFADRSRPFYGQAAPLALGRLPREALADYVIERFEQSNKDIGDALDWLLDLAEGHPQRAMLLAHLLWRHTPSGHVVSEAEWEAAYAEAWSYLQGDFEATWDSLTLLESGVVEAIAAGERTLTNAAVRERYALPLGSASSDASRRLVDRGLLFREGSGRDRVYRLVDPLLAHWISQGRRWFV